MKFFKVQQFWNALFHNKFSPQLESRTKATVVIFMKITECMLYAFFWVISRSLNFICWRFGTLCLLYLHRQVDIYLPMKMEHIECSGTSEYKIQTLRNYSEESIQRSEHGESLKSRNEYMFMNFRIILCFKELKYVFCFTPNVMCLSTRTVRDAVLLIQWKVDDREITRTWF